MTLLLLLALAQTPQHRLFMQPNLPRSSLAFFEAFPASGAGTTGVCSTTALTDARGSAATVTRATSAMCQSTAAGGMVSSGIANGELTLLSSGVARQEFDRNGVLGVRVERAATNLILRSEAIDNASWTKGAAVGTITADYATAPDGTQTADRFQYNNTNNNYVLQSFSVGGFAASGSDYLRGTSGSGTIYLCRGGAASQCVACAYTSTSWSRCVYDATLTTSSNLFVGCETATLGGACAQTGLDVLVWGLEGTLGASVTSYIPTAGATVARNADVVSFPVTLTGGTFSAGISYDTPSTLATGMTAFQIYVDSNNSITAALDASNKLVCTFRIGGSDSTVTTAGALTAGAVNRVACTYGAAGRSACLNGTCTTTAGALTMPTGAATFYGGTRSATGNEANGVLSRWCYEFASDARCVL